MSRILTVTIFALMLAGCASELGYDKSAMPEATAEARQAAAMCEKEQAPTKFSASKFMACRLAAERNFAMEIHLPKMDAFDTYAAQMMALAADYDAGQIYPKRMDTRAAYIRRHYLHACSCGLGGHESGGFSYDILPSVMNPPP